MTREGLIRLINDCCEYKKIEPTYNEELIEKYLDTRHKHRIVIDLIIASEKGSQIHFALTEKEKDLWEQIKFMDMELGIYLTSRELCAEDGGKDLDALQINNLMKSRLKRR